MENNDRSLTDVRSFAVFFVFNFVIDCYVIYFPFHTTSYSIAKQQCPSASIPADTTANYSPVVCVNKSGPKFNVLKKKNSDFCLLMSPLEVETQSPRLLAITFVTSDGLK